MPAISSFFTPIVASLVRLGISAFGRTRLPQVDGSLRLKGLKAPVQVLRDAWYVPHIYAQSIEDAIFAQGFVHAQERLWQMDFNRRVVAGRLSEVLGEGGLLPDRVMRTMGFRRVVEEEARQIEEPLAGLCQAYCQGVNAGIEQAVQRGRLPIEFSLLGYKPEPWVTADTLGFTKLMSWTLAGNWDMELMRYQVLKRLGPEKAAGLELDLGDTWAAILDTAPRTIDPSRPFTPAHASEGAGSNNWVVGGSRTASGCPLLANDMHLDLTAPAIWFENHIVGGDLEISGITIPGTPFITAGHNRYLAWGYTDGFNDVQDLYEEHLRKNPQGQVEYEFKGEWQPAEVRREEIRIKGGKTVVEEVTITCHGPIINLLFEKDFPDTPPLAMKWTAFEPETTVYALYAMNMARDCAEFHRAVGFFSGPGQNTVYADTQGNIGYTLSGRTPVRAKGEGLAPVPGWTGEYEWTGTIPRDEMPHLYNPARGYVVTANNPHSREPGGHYITRDYCQADRADRITELIEQNPRLDVAATKKMQYDLVSQSARVFLRAIDGLTVEGADLQEALRQLAGWDGTLSTDSREAALYQAVVRRTVRLMLDTHLGEFGVRLQGKGVAATMAGLHTYEWFIRLLEKPDSPWFDLGHGERRDDVLRLGLRQAVDEIKELQAGRKDSPTWGSLHLLTFPHILGAKKPLDAGFNLGPFAVGGDGTTISASLSPYYTHKTGTIVGPAFRFIADLSDLDHCQGVLAPGQSGHPASPHYADSIHPWLEGGYHPMLFKRDEVEKNLSARMELQPE